MLVLTRFPPETRGYSADVWSSAAFARRKFISAPECLWMLSYYNATGASPSAANDTVGGYMNMEAQLPQRHTHLRRQKVAIVEGVDKNIPYSVFFFLSRSSHAPSSHSCKMPVRAIVVDTYLPVGKASRRRHWQHPSREVLFRVVSRFLHHLAQPISLMNSRASSQDV